MRSVVALVALCTAAPALASGWTHFFDCGQGDQTRHYSYDEGSIRRQGAHLLVKIAGDYSGVKNSRAVKARMLFAIDCAGRTYHQERRTEYGANGRVVARYNSPTPAMTISPPGIGQKLFDRVCA
jgi:ribosomal protein L35AE/L33A